MAGMARFSEAVGEKAGLEAANAPPQRSSEKIKMPSTALEFARKSEHVVNSQPVDQATSQAKEGAPGQRATNPMACN